MSSLHWITAASHEIDTAVIATPAGKFRLCAGAGVLINSDWVDDDTRLQEPRGELLAELLRQLQDYWQAPMMLTLDVPLLLQGSAFSRAVWEALYAIPCGETRSYGCLAKRLQTSPRAIGAACRNNPFTLLIPCHRVVAVTGLGGYAGQRSGKLTAIKQRLLTHEKPLP